MTNPMSFDMLEATRLTREGRLEEAMALIQRRTAGGSSAANAQERPAPAPGFIDLTPPSHMTGDSWTVPNSPGGGISLPESSDMMAGLHIPAFLRSFANKLGRAINVPAADPAPLSTTEGRFIDRSFANAAGMRTYKLYIPAAYDGQKLPLVVMLHGCTQSPDDFAAGTRMNELAAAEHFFVAYPAQDQRANSAKCWNWFNASDQSRDQGEPSIIAGMTREIMDEFNIDSGRVYVCGLSAGGAAAAVLGMTYPDLFSAVGVHSGLACGAARDAMSAFAAMRQGSAGARVSVEDGMRKPAPVIVFHGDADKTVSPINGDEIIAQFHGATPLKSSVTQGQSPGGTRFTRTCKTTPDGRTILEHWVLHGLGHAWSGGSEAGTYTDPNGPDASREMIRFFFERKTTST